MSGGSYSVVGRLVKLQFTVRRRLKSHPRVMSEEDSNRMTDGVLGWESDCT
jgi:hypothetical protein